MVLINTGGNQPAQQVQADWNETDTSDPSYIQNKPTILNGYEYLSVGGLTSLTALATNQTVVYQLSMDQSPYGGSDYDFIIICEPESGIAISTYHGTGSTAYFTIKNCGPEISQFTFLATTYVYRRPKQKSTNDIAVIGSTSSDSVRAPELPTLGTAGKVLTVNSGATGVEWANVPSELPATLGTAGQVLTVNSGATGVEWSTPFSMNTATITVPANGGTVTVSGMTSTAILWVSPTSASFDVYVTAGCRCTAQATNSLTFAVTTTATDTMSVNVVWVVV